MRRVTVALPLALALAAVAPGLHAEDPVTGRKLEIDARAGEFRLFVKKKGALKAFAHDHEFDVRGYTGTIVWDASDAAKGSVALRIPSKEVALVDDGKLSPGDRAKIQEETLSDAILDVKKYPEIAFKSSSVVVHARDKDGALPLSVLGTLTLHGVSKQRTLEVKLLEKEGALEVSGEHAFLQSDFGIEPFSAALGMVGVQDEVTFKFRIVGKAPATAPEPAASPAPSPSPSPTPRTEK